MKSYLSGIFVWNKHLIIVYGQGDRMSCEKSVAQPIFGQNHYITFSVEKGAQCRKFSQSDDPDYD
jgi:hypothetical protein